MTFAYHEYLLNALMMPLFALAFVLAAIFFSLKPEIKNYFTTKEIEWSHLGRKLGLNIILLAMVVLMCVILSHGGFSLITERPKDAMTVTGTIEQIEARSSFESMKFWSDYGESYGIEFTVDEITCVAMAQGDLEVGDQVTVTYMPKSGFVLSIEETP